MAKTRSKNVGKSQIPNKKTKKKGLNSSADVRKTKSMEEILGVEPVELLDDEEDRVGVAAYDQPPLSPDSSLRFLKRQDDIAVDFGYFLAADKECQNSISKGIQASPPVLRAEPVMRNLESAFKSSNKEGKVKITMDDIEEEVAYWKSAIVCYVLGANPPLAVLEGFARRIWKDKVDKIGMVSYGVFLIIFTSIKDRDDILAGGYIFFNKKPVIMKAWDRNCNVKKEDIRTIPIWIQLEDLELKYWGQKSLFKIVGQLGKPIMVDEVTRERDKLLFPRILIEVSMEQEFPSLIYFENEFGIDVSVVVNYEWKPILCKHCKGMGHNSDDCRKKEAKKQEWVGWKPKNQNATAEASTSNQYTALQNGEDYELQRKEDRVTDEIREEEEDRRLLWKELEGLRTNEPWVVLGDFNDIVEKGERIGKRAHFTPTAFRECTIKCQLEDVKYGGSYFTWNNRQQGDDRIYSKIDRVMANPSWLNMYPIAEALFLQEGLFDHTPVILTVYPSLPSGRKPFKYFRMWLSSPHYQKQVADSWKGSVVGTKMYQIVTKLKRLKPVLTAINKHGFADVQGEEMRQEKEVREQYAEKHKVLISFLHQKSKLNWIKNGDSNTSVFHSSIKERTRHNRILSIVNAQGERVDDQEKITKAFLHYYKELLGTSMIGRQRVKNSVMKEGPLITTTHAETLMTDFSKEEIKAAMFSIPRVKSPGPDGYGSYFFQDNWDLVGDETCEAIASFLKSGNLLKEINSTVITLIPKIKCPNKVSDFRPISCCNVLYKVATKLICSRLKNIFPEIVSLNQGGFIKGRYITHNIMICQDLIRNYGRKESKPNCMIKLDLQKAYDTMDWDFLEEMLHAFEFLEKFIRLIMTCIRTPRYSLIFNGSMHGFFEAKKGLRQGDPISPLLFVLGMEYLSRIMSKIGRKEEFGYHERSAELKLNHLSFADDVLLVCRGDFKSIYLLMQGLKLFTNTSGLTPNKGKSAVFCSGMEEREIKRVLDMTGFSRQDAPFKYLGVPICARRIAASDCVILAQKMTKKIKYNSHVLESNHGPP
uniref:Reverse transcriptase domain-containing protein n=1 Tax=Cannabis sativa TaxID=3483 RepID=A0A803PQY4_CANSA